MSLIKLFEMQKTLDERIVNEKGLEGKDLLPEKILALQVELSELANELPESFKYWSNKKNNYQKALVEYCDCLHFILSIGNDLGMQDVRGNKVSRDTLIHQFSELQLFSMGLRERSRIDYLMLIALFIGLAEMLGFTWEQIEKAYFEKNAVNHVRQDTGY